MSSYSTAADERVCTEENNGSLPFFRLAIPGRGGIIGAIGWTGQWRADFGCADLPDPHCQTPILI